jgi:hypothetical protein
LETAEDIAHLENSNKDLTI